MAKLLLAFLLFGAGLVKSSLVPLDLSSYFNIKAASSGPDDSFADFDGSGRAYPVEWLPTNDTFSFRGIEVRHSTFMVLGINPSSALMH
jgi:alpha-L-fucosidase